MTNTRWLGVVVACVGLIVPELGVAATIPTSFTADAITLKKTAVAGTMVTFELHEDAACSAAIDSQIVDIDLVAVIEEIKPVKVNGGTKRAKIARLNFAFSGVNPTAGADLYVSVSGTGITPVDGNCQVQEPVGSGGAVSGGYAYIYNLATRIVAIGAAVPFDTNGEMSSSVVHIPGSSDITVTTSGTYRISFSVSGAEPNQFALSQNGVYVSGSRCGSGAGTQQNTGQLIAHLDAGDVIQLVNDSSDSAVTLSTLVGGTLANVNASILLSQL